MLRVSFHQVLVSFSLAGLLVCVHGKEWNRYDYPDPQKDLVKCGLDGIPSWICDPDHVLSEEQVSDVHSRLDELNSGTRCLCSSCDASYQGYKVAVAVMDKVSYNGAAEHVDLVANNFARYLRERWFSSGCGDNVLVLVTKETPQVYISAGVAARSKLPDSTVKSIVSSAQAQLDSKDFEAAILTVVNGVKSEFEDMDSTVLAIIIAACVLGLLTVVLVSVLVCLKLRSMKEDPKPTFFRPDKTRESHKSLAKSETHYDPNTDNVYVSLREPKTAEAVV
ncbi:uncharacterized protein LOC144883944 [Branchiostoma floridae x Branchiostoma japonicum]